jgi:hypothetical protein
MLPRSAVPVSHHSCASRTHIFSDRPLIKSRLVQAQNLYRHCPRSALFISASGDTHLALAPCRYLNRIPAESRTNKGWKEFGLSFFTGQPTTPLGSLLLLPRLATARISEIQVALLDEWVQGPRWVPAGAAGNTLRPPAKVTLGAQPRIVNPVYTLLEGRKSTVYYQRQLSIRKGGSGE